MSSGIGVAAHSPPGTSKKFCPRHMGTTGKGGSPHPPMHRGNIVCLAICGSKVSFDTGGAAPTPPWYHKNYHKKFGATHHGSTGPREHNLTPPLGPPQRNFLEVYAPKKGFLDKECRDKQVWQTSQAGNSLSSGKGNTPRADLFIFEEGV